jgi:hypothetical protein
VFRYLYGYDFTSNVSRDFRSGNPAPENNAARCRGYANAGISFTHHSRGHESLNERDLKKPKRLVALSLSGGIA